MSVNPRESAVVATIVQVSLYAVKMLAAWLYLRGHQEPGGGFVAGLVIAAAIALQGLAFGYKAAMSIFPVPPYILSGGGLLLAVSTVLLPVFMGRPFMDLTFTHVHLPLLGDSELATAAIFDLGVFFVVVGAAKAIILYIAEEKSQDQLRPGEAERGARSASKQASRGQG